MEAFAVKPLDETTWPDFARLVENHNGVWGGCWCMSFHAEGVGRSSAPAQNRARKQDRVRDGRAHAALVYDGTECVGWCQFGPTDELPRIKHRKAYLDGVQALPDWRITCFFVHRGYRCRPRSCTTVRWRCSNGTGSPVPAGSASTTGWSAGSSSRA